MPADQLFVLCLALSVYGVVLLAVCLSQGPMPVMPKDEPDEGLGDQPDAPPHKLSYREISSHRRGPKAAPRRE